MRIAVDDAEAAERKPPGREHRGGKTIASVERAILVLQQLAAVHPVKREQAAGRQFGPDPRHADGVFILEHVPVKRDVLALANVVELLAQARADLDRDFAGVDRRVEALAQRHQHLQLIEVGFDRRLHVGILQLAGQLFAVLRRGAMHLAERGRGRRVAFEIPELALPVGAKLGAHAALDESPAHRRRLALQLHQFVGVFGGQRVGNGSKQLRHLHDRAFQPAERRGQRQRIAGAVARGAHKALPGHARGHAADFATDIGVALGAGGEAIFFSVGGHEPRSTNVLPI